MIRKMKSGLGKMMNFIMLSCDDATLLMTKRSLAKISIIESMQLNMHLFSCKMCRVFKIQNELIEKELKIFDKKEFELPENRKIEINKEIKKELSNS